MTHITNLMHPCNEPAQIGWIYTTIYQRGAEKIVTKAGNILYGFKNKSK